jgi:hypothetical protein
MAALLTGSGACACSSPPIALELPPTTLAGDRVLVTVADGVVDAQWLETSAPLPTFTLPADGAIELTVLELGATRAALELADVAPTFAPPGRARGLARAPNIRSARIDAEGASAWEARAALDGPLSTLAAPFAVEPCFPLAMIERLPETSTEGVALLAQDATTTWLASGSRWWTLFADERPPAPLASPVWPLVVRADARTSGGAHFVLGERTDRGGRTLELWRQRRGLSPFERVFAEPLRAVEDEPLALAATSTGTVFWLTRGSVLVRLDQPPSGPPRRVAVTLGDGGAARLGGLAAQDRDHVVALRPYELVGAPRRVIAEVGWRGDAVEVRRTEVAAELAVSIGLDAAGAVWVGTNTADALQLNALFAAPFEVPQVGSLVTSITPARHGAWRGLMLRGTGGLLRLRWLGLSDDLRVDGYGDCTPGASGLDVRDALLVRGGAWIVAGRRESNEARVFWSPVPGLEP